MAPYDPINWGIRKQKKATLHLRLRGRVEESEMDRRRQHGHALNHVLFEGLNHVGDGPDGPVYATNWGS